MQSNAFKEIVQFRRSNRVFDENTLVPDEVIATVLDGNYKISTQGLNEINEMFSMKSPESDFLFLKWVESKIGFETSGYGQTPYTQYFPSYIQIKKR